MQRVSLIKLLNYRFCFSQCRRIYHRIKYRNPVIFSYKQNLVKCNIPLYLIPSFTLFYAICAPKSLKEESNTGKKSVSMDDVLREADGLYNENKFNDVYQLLLPYKESNNVEVLWRISRALYNMSKEIDDKTLKKNYVFESYETIKLALQLNNENYAVHKWYSILLDTWASYDGIKTRINHLLECKKHMMKAIELNESDATTLHMLGVWCFGIADMPWYQRKIASTLFATPPTSTYEEALYYFNKAEEVDPNFYSQNLLMLGKTYLHLKNVDKARHYLLLASKYPSNTYDDFQANKEAAELLKKL